jgi:mRNA interferase HigB
MTLLGRDLLDAFMAKHADTRQPLAIWIREVESSRWGTPQDIKNRYRSADFLSGNRVIFNLKGNHHRLVAVVSYQAGIVRITWIGTHAEYSKRRF